MTAPYRDMQPCTPGFCLQASAVGSELTCFGECVAARYLRGRPVADVDLPGGPTDGSDIEPAPGRYDWAPWEEATWD